MASVTRSIRADELKWRRWERAADGLSLNAWMVHRLDEAADLDLLQMDELAALREQRRLLKESMVGPEAA